MYPKILLTSRPHRIQPVLLILCLTSISLLTACSDNQAADATTSAVAESPEPTVETLQNPEASRAESTKPVAAAGSEATDNGEPAYEVKCDANGKNCKVDMDTFVGWRMYTSNCLACHGQDGKGSTIAPNLMDRLNAHVDYPRFTDVVTNGFTGTIGAMPSFENSQNVIDRIPSIYKYLKARADGVLGGGRPERLP